MKKIVNKVNRKLVQLYVRSQVLLMDKSCWCYDTSRN